MRKFAGHEHVVVNSLGEKCRKRSCLGPTQAKLRHAVPVSRSLKTSADSVSSKPASRDSSIVPGEATGAVQAPQSVRADKTTVDLPAKWRFWPSNGFNFVTGPRDGHAATLKKLSDGALASETVVQAAADATARAEETTSDALREIQSIARHLEDLDAAAQHDCIGRSMQLELATLPPFLIPTAPTPVPIPPPAAAPQTAPLPPPPAAAVVVQEPPQQQQPPPPPPVQVQEPPHVHAVPQRGGEFAGRTITPEGTGKEVLLQGFNWESCRNRGKSWYEVIMSQAAWFGQLGLTAIWLPPPTDSVSPEGYLPRDLYNLTSQYGNMQQLQQCVAVLQENGLKVLGDVVLNHRCAQYQNKDGIWNQFGGKLAWDARAIVSDDPNFRGQGARGTGDLFHAAPNIDHSQDFVRNDICEWLQWLKTNVKFDGWRLDFVRGFSGKFVKEYMESSWPSFAVGEYWDSLLYNHQGVPEHNQDGHRQRIINWLNSTGGFCTAFDVTTKGILHAVFERKEFWRLRDAQGKPPGVMGWWPSRAVTFLENHDTGSTQGHWRFPDFGLEPGYAYILTHPGTPTVFYDHLVHFQGLQDPITRLIRLRHKQGIGCRSAVKIVAAEQDKYVAEIDDRVCIRIGPGSYTPSSEWRKEDSGHWWCVWVRT